MQESHPFTETRAARGAFEAFDALRMTSGVGLVVGESGCGKSAILAAYARHAAETSPGAVLRIRAHAVGTPLGLVRALLGSLDVGLAWHGHAREGLEVFELLGAAAGVRMVLVDDAMLLDRPALETLRLLREHTGVGLVLAGGMQLPRGLGVRCAALAEAVRMVHRVAPLGLADVLALLETPAWARRVSPWQRAGTARALLTVSEGNVRRLLQVLEELEVRARRRRQPISPDMLDELAGEGWVA